MTRTITYSRSFRCRSDEQHAKAASPPSKYQALVFSVGGAYHVTSALALRAGAGWDESPVTTHFRTVGVPDANRYMIGVGAGYTFAPGTIVDFGYSHYWAAENATLNGSVNSVDAFTGAVALSGDWHNYIDYFALSFRFAL